MLYAHLMRAKERHKTNSEHFAYLLCDIDDLDSITSQLGRGMAEHVVREVAVRISDALPGGDHLSRISGARFAVLASDSDGRRAAWLMRSITEAVEGVVAAGPAPVWASVAIGAASTSDVPAHAVDLSAVSALQHAKQSGRGSAFLFHPGAPTVEPFIPTQQVGPPDPSVAGASGLSYQPIVRLGTHEVVGAELAAGCWALPQVCRDATRWPHGPQVSIKLPPAQLTLELPNATEAALTSSGLPPERLCFEVTESAVLESRSATQVLRELARRGIRIALDHFGTGDQAMSALRDLPLNAVKLDRTFVELIGRSADDTAIATTMIKLAGTLCVPVVATGVATSQQLSLLRGLGCQYAQGDLWSAAVPAGAFAATAAEIAGRDVPPFKPHRAVHAVREPDAATRAFIVAMHHRGASPASIAASLNQDGVGSPSCRRWSQADIAHLIAQWP